MVKKRRRPMTFAQFILMTIFKAPLLWVAIIGLIIVNAPARNQSGGGDQFIFNAPDG